MIINRDTRIIDLTIGEFEDWLKSNCKAISGVETHQEKNYVYGLEGIMNLFGCSKSKAERLKNGKIAQACKQNGRSIVVDAHKAMELFNS